MEALDRPGWPFGKQTQSNESKPGNIALWRFA
jgi:hypothetical protein